ncbi:MAG: VOC family protein [Propionibacteriaceae bacterium]|nr:VOC family protein [Propionibacteriaceae bacterium]
MRLDHLSYAAGPAGLDAEVVRLQDLLGAKFRDGGVHPRFGTRNNILPLSGDRYLEVVEVLDHPVAEKAVFGQAVRARSEVGGGWLAWVISVDDMAPVEARLNHEALPGSRTFPDGRLLEWRQLGVTGLMTDPQLPFFIKWTSEASLLPSALDGTIDVTELEIGGSRTRVEDWLGEPIGNDFDGVHLRFASPAGHPGLDAVTFNCPGRGLVRI